MRTKPRRVGSTTCGILLILFGALFLLHAVLPALTFGIIFRLWPILLISLGVELLIVSKKTEEEKLRYDGAAIALMFIVALFALGMGVADYCMSITGLTGSGFIN